MNFNIIVFVLFAVFAVLTALPVSETRLPGVLLGKLGAGRVKRAAMSGSGCPEDMSWAAGQCRTCADYEDLTGEDCPVKS